MTTPKMVSHRALIEALGPQKIAEAMRLPPNTVYSWSHRNQIPPEYWPWMVTLFERAGSPYGYAHLAEWTAQQRLSDMGFVPSDEVLETA